MTTPTYFRELTAFGPNGEYLGFARQDGASWQVFRRSTDPRAWAADMRRRTPGAAGDAPVRLKAPKAVGTERKAREALAAMGAAEIEDSRGGLTLATDDEPELIAG